MAVAGEIPIEMLLLKDVRTEVGRSTVQARAHELGLVPTSGGVASLCFRADPETFVQLFGVSAAPLPGVAATDADFGAPPGYRADVELTVPQALREYVSQVSVSPPALRFTEAG